MNNIGSHVFLKPVTLLYTRVSQGYVLGPNSSSSHLRQLRSELGAQCIHCLLSD